MCLILCVCNKRRVWQNRTPAQALVRLGLCPSLSNHTLLQCSSWALTVGRSEVREGEIIAQNYNIFCQFISKFGITHTIITIMTTSLSICYKRDPQLLTLRLGECLLISSSPGNALRTLVYIARLAEQYNMRSQSRAW